MTMQYELFSDAELRQETPFTRRSVCLVGSIRMSGGPLKQRLLSMGADIKQSPSRNVHYVVMGADVPSDAAESLRQLAYNGFHPMRLDENDLADIFAGHYSPYFVPEKITKHLHLTLRHYLSSRMSYGTGMNPLYTRELYLPPDLATPQAVLYQKLGNRGVYANAYIDDTTDVIVISDASLQRLREGTTDEHLHYIEAQYDQSRAQSFRYTLTSEGELLAWLNHAAGTFPAETEGQGEFQFPGM